MTALTTQGYAYEANHDGTYSILDTVTGECVGTSPDEAEAVKAVKRMTNLYRANTIRIGRAAIKRELKQTAGQGESCETLAAILEDNPPTIATMRVEELLRCVRSHQPQRRKATLSFAGCSNVKLVEDLTDRQRARLCEALRMTADEFRAARS